MYRVALALAGFDVHEAGDGLDALTQIDAQPPDIVVLDLILPAVNGHVVRQEIAAGALTRHIPIVVVTGSTGELDHLDVACLLRKPVSPERLIDAVHRCLASGAGPNWA